MLTIIDFLYALRGYIIKSKIPFADSILVFLARCMEMLSPTVHMKHYGCPASNRTKKLQLKKHLFKI